MSYAHADADTAQQVATALRDAGIGPWLDVWDLRPGDTISERVSSAVASSDVFLLLLSPNAIGSKWLRDELTAAFSGELRDRGIWVVPALIEDCEIPTVLANSTFIDMRDDFDSALETLTAQLEAAMDIDFSKLNGSSFERLASDLLTTLGFSIQEPLFATDEGFDLVATYRSRDPFGRIRTETWLVETKLYREGRLSIAALRQLAAQAHDFAGIHRAIVITNSGMTSVAREFIRDLEREQGFGFEVRVVDGEELARLLMQHPPLVDRHFRGRR